MTRLPPYPLSLRLLLWLALAVGGVLLSSCGVTRLFRRSPEQKLAALVSDYPQLKRADTVRVPVVVRVPSVSILAAPLPIPARAVVSERRDRDLLDSLLTAMESRLDSAQRAAVRGHITRLVFARPRADTVRFDTLGVVGRIWWRGGGASGMQQAVLSLERRALVARDTVPVGVERLTLVPLDKRFYDPSGWPWWLLLMLGAFGGGATVLAIIRRTA